MPLSYSSRSARAIGFLKSVANDVEIFVEDASRVKVWTAIVRSCLPQNVRFSSVTALGNRDQVLEACRADQVSSRPRLYIIDGDWDFLLGKGCRRLGYLHRISATNLEAMLCNKRGILKIVEELCPVEDIKAVETEFDAFFEEVWGKKLRHLFAFYALNHLADGTRETASYHISRLTEGGVNPWRYSLSLMAARAQEICTEVKEKAPSKRRQFRKIRQRSANLPLAKAISGKTYLWPLVLNWLSYRYAIRTNPNDLMLLIIARSGCISTGLRRKLRAVAHLHP